MPLTPGQIQILEQMLGKEAAAAVVASQTPKPGYDWGAIARHVVAVTLTLLGMYGITITYAPKSPVLPPPVIQEPSKPAVVAPAPALSPAQLQQILDAIKAQQKPDPAIQASADRLSDKFEAVLKALDAMPLPQRVLILPGAQVVCREADGLYYRPLEKFLVIK